MKLPPLGLDIAESKFNACLIRDGGKLRHKVFANTAARLPQLSDWLEKQGAGQRARLHGGHRHLRRRARRLPA